MVTSRETILIVTANETFARTLEKYLNEYNYATIVARDAVSGLDAARRVSPILVLVDRSQQSLLQLGRDPALRKVPVVAVQPPQANCSEDECLEDLEQGVDASICPKGYRELIARIRAIIRREQSRSARKSQYVVGNLSLDKERHEVKVKGQLVDLTPKEFQILQHLMQNPARAFTRDELVDHVWGEGAALESHTLDVHIHSLRQKIERNPADPRIVVTVRGVGYKLKAAS